MFCMLPKKASYLIFHSSEIQFYILVVTINVQLSPQFINVFIYVFIDVFIYVFIDVFIYALFTCLFMCYLYVIYVLFMCYLCVIRVFLCFFSLT